MSQNIESNRKLRIRMVRSQYCNVKPRGEQKQLAGYPNWQIAAK